MIVTLILVGFFGDYLAPPQCAGSQAATALEVSDCCLASDFQPGKARWLQPVVTIHREPFCN